jgi:hypothetical protein
MENGTYEFPDGKAKYSTTEEGLKVFRVVQAEALRYGWQKEPGWKANDMYQKVFGDKDSQHHQFYMKALTKHRMRLAGGFTEELAKLTDDGDALSKMSKRLYDTLMDDLNDPDRSKDISFRDRAALYEKVTKLEAQTKGDFGSQGRQPVIRAQTVIGQLNLPNSVRERVQKQVADLELEAHDEE